MYTVYFTNMGYASERKFVALNDALYYAKTKGFQASIHDEFGNLKITWCPITGTKTFELKQREMQQLGIRPADAIF